MLIHWHSSDSLLAGPYSCPEATAAFPFEVPERSQNEICFGRIRPGAAWPAHLDPVERLVAIPKPENDISFRNAASRDVVLCFEISPGQRTPICMRCQDGTIRWSIHPADWLRCILSEAYVAGWRRPLTSRLPALNYSRLPHSIKGMLQNIQGADDKPTPVPFPRLPFDDLVEVIRKLCLALSHESEPGISDLWPDCRRAAVTLTHDVDTSWILRKRNRPVLREILETETSLGFKGAWYITGDQVDTSKRREALELIADAGHELGPHGWNHDSKLNYLNESRQETRLRKARARFSGIEVSGIRTPWYCRSLQLFRVLSRQFTYDTSVPNSSAFFSARTHSGCCTVFPYQPLPGLFELPMTLPPDNFRDLTEGYRISRSIAAQIVDRGGVVVTTFHPQPHQSANREGLDHYFAFLDDLSQEFAGRLWSATPAEILRHYCKKVAGSRA